jgi:intraflagellar transport protein 46
MTDRALTGDASDAESGSDSNEFSGRKGNDNDFSFGESYDSAGGALHQMRQPAGKSENVMTDQPYDEAVELGDDDESDVVSTPASSDNEGEAPKKKAAPGPSAAQSSPKPAPQQQQKGPAPVAEGSDESSSSSSDESDTEAGGPGVSPKSTSGAAPGQSQGSYNASEYDSVEASPEIKELFQYISRYKPDTIELETTLKPFIPDFVPCIGEVDACIKMPRPDGKPEMLGLARLDEPCLCASDPSVLDLQLRALSKRTDLEPMEVRSLEDAEKNPKDIKNWIDRVGELHRQKPAPTVAYSRKMPDIEQLMQVWPAEFEEYLQANGIPEIVDLDVDLKALVKIIASVLDVPVYDQITESLHVIFTLFSEFKSNQHFAQAESVAQNFGGGFTGMQTMQTTHGGGFGGMGGLGSTIGSNRGGFQEPGWNSRVASPTRTLADDGASVTVNWSGMK